jgi:hypothetical protein
MTPVEQITSLYIGYFGRAPDPEGLNYWVGRLADGFSLAEIAESFSVQAESQAKYPYLSNPNIASPQAFITQVYLNLFNRLPDAEGLAYWTNELESGGDVGDFILNVISGAVTDPDQQIIENKIEVGVDFALDAANTAGFVYDAAAANAAAEVINGVDETEESVAEGKAETDEFLAGGTAGSNFVLNESLGENIQGSINNDQISAVLQDGGVSTLNVGDQINGGAGFDTLNLVTNTGTLPAGVSIDGVERVNLTLAADVTVDSADFGDDVEQLWLEGAENNTVTLDEGVTLGLGDLGGVGTTGVTQRGSTFSLALDDLADSQTINVAGVGATDIETINVSGTVADGVDVVLNNADATALNLAIASDADIEAQGLTDLETIDGSESTGNLQLDLAGLANLESVIGGSGDDYIIFGTNFDASVDVDGGEGDDTVQVTIGGTVSAGERLALNALTNVETLYFNDPTVTVNVSQITSVDTFGFEGTATVTGISDDTTIVGGAGASAQTLTLSHADSTNDTVAGTVNVVSNSDLTVVAGNAGFETLVVSGQGTLTFDNGAAAGTEAATVIDLSGLGLDADNNGVVDFAGFNGGVTSEVTLAAGVVEEITLSQGIDILDVSSSTFENLDVVNDFTVEGDYADTLVVDFDPADLVEFELSDDADSLGEAFLEAAASSEDAVYFQFEGNTYLYVDSTGNDDLDDGDFAVQLTGSLDLSNANFVTII